MSWLKCAKCIYDTYINVNPVLFNGLFYYITLPEKSDVIVKTLKYFETLTLIVRIKRQENQLILIMTLEAH